MKVKKVTVETKVKKSNMAKLHKFFTNQYEFQMMGDLLPVRN